MTHRYTIGTANKTANKTDAFVVEFFRRHPQLSKYRSRIRFREREQGGSAGHGEARQHGDEVWLFPKFWTHDKGVQDFVLAHEVGHWVKSDFGGREFIALANGLGIDPWDSSALPFGQFNMDEAFADCFASYHTDKDVLRRYPEWARLVEAVEAGERPMRTARNKSKKDVGHGGLDEWFSGHGEGKGKDKGEATWGDWVAISPVKKKVKQELADGTVKEKTVKPGDIVGPCGVSDDPNWKSVTRDGKDPLKCMPRQKAHDTPKSERAELAREKMKAERDEGNRGKKPTRTPTFDKKGGENEPTNPDLWEKSKDEAKERYTKWPSAYAVGHALKLYKEEGGKWKKEAAVGKHTLPPLPYAYDALEPHISEDTLRQHHDKHHKAYVDGLNKAEKALAGARADGDYEAVPALNAALEFHAGGNYLHTLYWPSLVPTADYEEPSEELVEAIEADFGSWDAFRAQMKESTVKVRGSGWGVLVLTPSGLRVVTVMNHENGVLWDGVALLPIDAWEHAYYLDYQSDREAHFDAVFDHLVSWPEVERRLTAARDTVRKKQARAVAARYYLHQEVRRVCASRLRVASREGERVRRELTPEVMLAFVEASGVRVATMKVAFDVVKKVKQLWEAFTSVRGAWDKFKRLVGVKADSLLGALKELPRKVVELGKKGKDLLHKTGGWLVEHVPFFRIYSEARGKMPALNTYLFKLVDYLPPRVAGALKAVGRKAQDLAGAVDEYIEKHPIAVIAGTLASAAIFTQIWLNVTEISWDVGDIVRGFLGMYSFVELLKSLPEAGVGFLLSLLFPGLPSRYLLNALLPVTVALRIGWMVAQHYASWENGSLVIHWAKLGIEPPSDPMLLSPA